jgi:enoyl-CoA hydratase
VTALVVQEVPDRLVVTLCRPEARDVLDRAHALLDRMARSGPLALRLTKLVADAPGGRPVADDLAQAILFESDDKRARMDASLAGHRS